MARPAAGGCRSTVGIVDVSAAVGPRPTDATISMRPRVHMGGQDASLRTLQARSHRVLSLAALLVPTKQRCHRRRRSGTPQDHSGTEIDSPSSAGVCTGRRRACVACSKLYPRDKSLCSPNAGPKKEIPTGRSSPVNPAGTIRSGKPVRLAMFVADAVGPAGPMSGGAASNAGLRGDVGYTIASSFSAAKRPSTVARTNGRP